MLNNHQREHIADLVPLPKEIKPKQEIYKSIHNKQVKIEEKENRFCCKTMGKIKTTPPNPKQPVTQGTGDKRRTILAESRRAVDNHPNPIRNRKPAVPSVKQLPKYAKKLSKIDKIHENAMRNINSVSKKPKNICVDSVNGHKNEIDNSGLVPKYVKKVDYGKLPSYILKRNAEVQNAENLYDAYLNKHLEEQAAKEISQEERLSLLTSLKKKWEQLNYKYQGLSVVTDTVPKKFRKEKLEEEMSDVQADIKFLERHTKIFIN